MAESEEKGVAFGEGVCMRLKTYYLSGPMTGYANWNYPEFVRVARWWRARLMDEACVVNPAENYGGDPRLPRSVFMRHDIATLLTVDGVILLHGWEQSRGARLEYDIARALDLEVIFDEDYRRQRETGGVRDGVPEGHAGGEGSVRLAPAPGPSSFGAAL